MQVGTRVKAARLDHKLTMLALAEASQLTKGFISQVENGHSNPSLGSLRRIASALGVSLGSLMDAEEQTKVTTQAPSTPALLLTRNIYQESGVSAIAAEQTGTHLVSTLPVGASLRNVAVANLGERSYALCVVLRGNVTVSQGGAEVAVGPGEVANWNAARPYSLENRGVVAANLLIFLPQGCEAPALVGRPAIQPNQPALYSSARVAASGMAGAPTHTEGPLRLVAMRAQRTSERRR